MYKIEIKSDFAELHRYDLVITCGGFDSLGEQLYVTGSESTTLICESAASIVAIIYVVANALPQSKVINDSPPFDLEIIVTNDDEEVYRQTHKVNQWGGASIEIKL